MLHVGYLYILNLNLYDLQIPTYGLHEVIMIFTYDLHTPLALPSLAVSTIMIQSWDWGSGVPSVNRNGSPGVPRNRPVRSDSATSKGKWYVVVMMSQCHVVFSKCLPDNELQWRHVHDSFMQLDIVSILFPSLMGSWWVGNACCTSIWRLPLHSGRHHSGSLLEWRIWMRLILQHITIFMKGTICLTFLVWCGLTIYPALQG